MVKSLPSLSVCVIARNEATNLPRALASVKAIAREVLLVDTGSTDQTIAVARAAGARVIQRPWRDNFAYARNASMEQASGDWLLILDADEAVSQGMQQALPDLLADKDVEAYRTLICDDTTGVRMPVLRLFRNGRGYQFQGPIHEQVESSIASRGGRIKQADVEIIHYGYNPGEDSRKNRRERNIRILTRSLKEKPERHQLWYYLGCEYGLLWDYPAAERSFQTMMNSRPTDELSILSATLLADLLMRQQRSYEAWSMALKGINTAIGHCDALIRTAQAALMEGDYVVAQECTAAVRQAPANAIGQIPRHPGLLADLEASAAWEEGLQPQALQRWRAAAQANPMDARIADRWVRHLVSAQGLQQGSLGAIRQLRQPTVVAAAIGAVLRAGQPDTAAQLSQSAQELDLHSPYLIHGLARIGDWERATALAAALGVEGELHLATAAIWLDRPDRLQSALEQMPDLYRTTLQSLLSGEISPLDRQWVLWSWMTLWADIGCHQLFQLGANHLAGDPEAQTAKAALLLYRSGQLDQALALASGCSGQPDALEVLGLMGFDAGDMEAAAAFLPERAAVGPAPVRVYHKGALALNALGQSGRASHLLALGREARPLAKLLQR